jgi:hypothetical protein
MGEQLIADNMRIVYHYEGGGASFNSGFLVVYLMGIE